MRVTIIRMSAISISAETWRLLVASWNCVTMVAGNFDLSVGNIAGLSQVMTASLYANHHANMWVGIVFGVAIGAGPRTSVGWMAGSCPTTHR